MGKGEYLQSSLLRHLQACHKALCHPHKCHTNTTHKPASRKPEIPTLREGTGKKKRRDNLFFISLSGNLSPSFDPSLSAPWFSCALPRAETETHTRVTPQRVLAFYLKQTEPSCTSSALTGESDVVRVRGRCASPAYPGATL